ncbi:MAG: hypothetical protein A3C82_00045 [Candidatus Wildermuthbacteria bacterium RIFCSPHIGHO2_02_FULL_47_12]|uniref:Uncharacterized protein n=1 Tax=Candidatus Wildermuthbacteria bacterium RIFCSPHIGHO2_02_FULL_47_12 TaxID=1802451 RepID=A0A1G2R2Y6_9BACT|nr:MAG: hypothetical protein A3C82_00045 [Candidatus Wildermuthbacteria bacterium RIFCSPHIGHO2_02_FULL_47_12]
MAKTVTPSITRGQISKIQELLDAGLRKSGLPSEEVQQVLGQPDFVDEMVGVLRKRVEAVSDMIVRHVKVDRSRSPQQMLDATGFKQYLSRDVVNVMPRGEGEEVEVRFFKLKRYSSPAEVAEAFRIRVLMPDPIAQAQANTDDPSFMDEHPNGTQWQDADGNWCYIAFSRWSVGRYVRVNRSDDDWSDDWWLAGVPQVAL